MDYKVFQNRDTNINLSQCQHRSESQNHVDYTGEANNISRVNRDWTCRRVHSEEGRHEIFNGGNMSHRDMFKRKRSYQINEPVQVFVKIPGSQKGYFLEGIIETEKTQGLYRVYFPHVEVGGRKGTRGWYRPSDISTYEQSDMPIIYDKDYK
jgi:hypothetical protein